MIGGYTEITKDSCCIRCLNGFESVKVIRLGCKVNFPKGYPIENNTSYFPVKCPSIVT